MKASELHIGAHVEVDGERREICTITKRKIGYHRRADRTDNLAYTRLDELVPIPLTPELLTELGFGIRDEQSLFWIKSLDGGSAIVSHDGDKWKVNTYASYVSCRLGMFRQIEYLHELEAFIFMTLHKRTD